MVAQGDLKNDVLDELLNYLRVSENLNPEQIPEILFQTLKYEKISGIVELSIYGFLMVVTVAIGCFFLLNPTQDGYGNWTTSSFMGALVPSALAFMFFCSILRCIDKLIKINLAPKYFLMDLFMKMQH